MQPVRSGLIYSAFKARLGQELASRRNCSMAKAPTFNTKALEALGAQRLAALLLDIAEGDAAIKRRLRLELAGAAGG